MKKFVKPASLLLYSLSIVVFFLTGMFYAGITNAAEGQGLAGGAIVVGYGFLFSLIALVVAFFVAYYATHQTVVITNRILLLLFVILVAYIFFRYQEKQNEHDRSAAAYDKVQNDPKVLTAAISPNMTKAKQETENSIGLGFFKPEFYHQRVLYFYGNPNLEKSVLEHTPTDSIVFQRTEYGIDIAYAPPWLAPDHLKLDYDILYFRAQSLSSEFIEVTVNTHTRQTAYVERSAGNLVHWPEFLLNLHSVEFIESQVQPIRYKPLLHAGEVPLTDAIVSMKPIVIRNDWMLVDMLNDKLERINKGWIQWQKDGRLLLTYSLLS